MLEAAGLTVVEETVYRLLVGAVTASAHELAEQSELPRATLEAVLAGLTGKGLASPTDHVPPQYSAVPPDVALLPRLQRRTDELDKARGTVTDLLDLYRSTRRRQDAGQLIEVITGAESLRQHLRQMQDNADHEMLWFCKAQYVAMPSGSNRAEYDALARGVRYRVLYEQAFFDDDHAVDNVIEGVQAGEIARSVPHLPLRLAVADRAIAICPLVPGGPRVPPASPPRPWSARAVSLRRSPRSSNATGRQRSPWTSARRAPSRTAPTHRRATRSPAPTAASSPCWWRE